MPHRRLRVRPRRLRPGGQAALRSRNEALELSHYSLVQYRLPGTRELVPLLQIAPSKTDAERLLISPDLADVLAAIIRRIRDPGGAVPLVRGLRPPRVRLGRSAPLLPTWMIFTFLCGRNSGTGNRCRASAARRLG